MFRRIIVVFVLLVLMLVMPGQAVKRDIESVYRSALRLYDDPNSGNKSDSLALRSFQTVISDLTGRQLQNGMLADSYLKSGILRMQLNDQAGALQSFYHCIGTVKTSTQLADSLLFQPNLYAGSIHYDFNQLDSARYYYNQAESIKNKYPRLNESERLYNKLGALFYETADYQRSISYFEKALSVLSAGTQTGQLFFVNYRSNIGSSLLKLHRYDEAISLFSDLLKYHVAEDGINYNLGNAWFEKGDYARALGYLRKVRGIPQGTFNNLARVFLKMGQRDSASVYLNRAQAVYLAAPAIAKAIDEAITLKYLGDLHAAGRDFSIAIQYYQHSINVSFPSFTDTIPTHNPTSFAGTQNFAFLFDAIAGKAAAMKALDAVETGKGWLAHAFDGYAAAIELLNHVEKTFGSDDARIFLKSRASGVTEDAISIALQLAAGNNNDHYQETAFQLLENYKASVLQARLQDVQLAAIPGMPAALLQQEKNYKSLLSKLNLQALRPADSGALLALRKKIGELEFDLAEVQKQLDQNERYHQLKYAGNKGSGISTLASRLDRDEAVLSYFYTRQLLVCFYLSKENSGVLTRPLSPGFFSAIDTLRRNLETPEGSDRNVIREKSAFLYNELIAPLKAQIGNNKHLIVIPYNEISYVPFELLRAKDQTGYVLEQYSVSYNYSANFISDINQNVKGKYEVLAMAPFTDTVSNSRLPQLKASAAETADLPGLLLTGHDATKTAFENSLGNFPVIHLATHAVANDSNLVGSYIEFFARNSDPDSLHRLYEQEIYTLDLKSARLVILSACETGKGALINGEGIMSLSRAFAYAGCKSEITSLWKADDISTSFIVKHLHQYLREGMTKDDALRRAKTEYLSSSDIDDRYKSPIYWAHLILIGDHDQLVPASGHAMSISLIVAGMLVLLFTIFKIKNRM